jgi:hypothetical protein
MNVKTISALAFAGALGALALAFAPTASPAASTRTNLVAQGVQIVTTPALQACVDKYGEGLRDVCESTYGH